MNVPYSQRSLQHVIHSVPEVMIQNYGKNAMTATFKLIHSGETYTLPHYDFDAKFYCEIYIVYLKMLIDREVNIELFYVDDRVNAINVSDAEHIENKTIGEFIYSKYHSRPDRYAFYIKVDDTKQNVVQSSLITNNTFDGECTICYQTTKLNHYYRCDIKAKNIHHGICESCNTSWQDANSNHTCPTCRADKLTSI